MHQLLTIDVSSENSKGLGKKEYKSHPRVGEWIEINNDEVGHIFEVVMIAHSDSGDGSDVYVKKLGETSSVIKTICNKS